MNRFIARLLIFSIILLTGCDNSDISQIDQNLDIPEYDILSEDADGSDSKYEFEDGFYHIPSSAIESFDEEDRSFFVTGVATEILHEELMLNEIVDTFYNIYWLKIMDDTYNEEWHIGLLHDSYIELSPSVLQSLIGKNIYANGFYIDSKHYPAVLLNLLKVDGIETPLSDFKITFDDLPEEVTSVIGPYIESMMDNFSNHKLDWNYELDEIDIAKYKDTNVDIEDVSYIVGMVDSNRNRLSFAFLRESKALYKITWSRSSVYDSAFDMSGCAALLCAYDQTFNFQTANSFLVDFTDRAGLNNRFIEEYNEYTLDYSLIKYGDAATVTFEIWV